MPEFATEAQAIPRGASGSETGADRREAEDRRDGPCRLGWAV